MNEIKYTADNVGDRGAIAVCQALRVNTTLASLSMQCEEVKRERQMNSIFIIASTDNSIGVEAIHELTEALKVNPTLTYLDMDRE